MTDQERFIEVLKNQKEGVWEKEEFIIEKNHFSGNSIILPKKRLSFHFDTNGQLCWILNRALQELQIEGLA